MKKKLLIIMLVLAMSLSLVAPALAWTPPDNDYGEEPWIPYHPNGTGAGWLSQSLINAIENPEGPNTIVFPMNYNLGTREIGSGRAVQVNRPITIMSNNETMRTLTAGQGTTQPHFVINDGGSLTLININLEAPTTPTQGGITVNAGGELYLINSEMFRCYRAAADVWSIPMAGALLVKNGGYAEVTNCTFRNNVCGGALNGRAGAIYVEAGGELILTDTFFTGNNVPNPSNANVSSNIMYEDGAKISFENVSFSNGGNNAATHNKLPDNGFGVGVNGETLTVDIGYPVVVTFDSDGGSEVEPQSVVIGEKAIQPDDPTKDGYEFLGWFLDDEEFDFDTEITEAITLTAKWGVYAVGYDVTTSSTNLQDKTTVTLTVKVFYSDGSSEIGASASVKLKQNGTQKVTVGSFTVTVVVNGNNKITNLYI